MMPTMRWRAASAEFPKRHRQKATTTWQSLSWFHPSHCPQLLQFSRLVGADDPFNLANVRSFKARGNHRLWQRQRAEAETVTASAAGSRQQATCEWWHFACLPSRRQRLRLRTKYWWGCSLCWSTWRLADGRHVQSMQHFLSIDINQRGKETAREGHCVPTLVALLMWLMLTLKDAQRQTDRQTERDS